MSKYQVNKIMRRITQNAEAHEEFLADREGFVARWEAVGEAAREDPDLRPNGGQLTDEERRAIVERDSLALYAMGAHPFITWHFTEATLTRERPRPEVVEWFKKGAAEIGYPDYTT